MEFKVRTATRKDKEQMLQIYDRFTEHFVGSASRTLKSFTRMLQKEDNVNYVALDSHNKIVGYVHAAYNERNRTGEFRDIVVDPNHDFIEVARLLVEKVNAAFSKKKAAAIVAASLRNPAYEKIFPNLGFMESESRNVFMYAILDVQRLLSEMALVFADRLRKADDWKGLVQVQCDEHSLFLEKAGRSVQRVLWTNRVVDFRVKLSRAILAKLILGVGDSAECLKTGQLEVGTTFNKANTTKLLEDLFPRSQFLIMDFW